MRADGLGRAIGETHRRYTNFIDARGRRTGHPFQSRFASVLLDDDHILRAVRYVSLNPVRARLVARPEQWPWSSVCAHLAGVDTAVLTLRPALDRIPHLKVLLDAQNEEDYADLRRAEKTGRPLATAEQLVTLEKILGRRIARRSPGRKPLEKSIPNRQLSLL